MAALIAASVAAAAGCHKPEADTKKDPGADTAAAAGPISTKFIKVVEQKVAPRLEVNGTLDPDERSEIAAQTNGAVLSVHVDIGSRVKKGDVLVELDPKEASLRLDVANATTASQRARLGLTGGKFDLDSVADVKMAKEAAELAKTELERAKMLFDAGAISKAQYDQAKSVKDRADAAYDAARNGAQQTFVGLMASQSQANINSKSVDDTKVRAPFDGRIDAKRVAPGEFATTGRVVAVLVREDPLRFRFDVPEAQSAMVTEGSVVEIRVAAHPERTFKGEVKRIAASVRAQSRTLPIEAEFQNADHLLRPGFFARGTVFLSGESAPVLMVPKSALLPVNGGSKLFVKHGDKVQERLVVAGSLRGGPKDELIEVIGQLAVGDEVATENLDQLADGVSIKP